MTTRRQFILLTMTFSKENATWVGVCEEFQVSTFGEDFDQVNEELRDLVKLTVQGMISLGTLDAFLHEHEIPVFSAEPSKEDIQTLPEWEVGRLMALEPMQLGA